MQMLKNIEPKLFILRIKRLDDVSNQDLRCSQIQPFFDSGILRVNNDGCLIFEDGLCYLGSFI